LSLPPESESENASIVLVEILVGRNNFEEAGLVFGKIGQSSQEPAVANFTLNKEIMKNYSFIGTINQQSSLQCLASHYSLTYNLSTCVFHFKNHSCV
jgi:hypothetical protein